MTPIERARKLVGSPFRPGGRDPAIGLDCLGVAATTFGLTLPSIRDHQHNENWVFGQLEKYFEPALALTDGDLIVMRQRGRWHFGVADGDALIHADARSRRVVKRAFPPPWPVVVRLRPRKSEA